MGRLGYILQWVFSWDTYAFLWLCRIILLLLVGGAEIFRKKRITHIAIFMVRPPPYSAFVFPSFWVSTTLLKYFHVVGCLRFFSMNSLHNFLNEFVVLFLPERILLLYFFVFILISDREKNRRGGMVRLNTRMTSQARTNKATLCTM